MYWKDYIWNPSTWNCKKGNYLGSIVVDSVIACDDVIKLIKTIPNKTLRSKAIPIENVPTKTFPTNFIKEW